MSIMRHIKRILKTGKSRWYSRSAKLEIFRHQITVEVESQRTLLAVSITAMGYNVFLLTNGAYHSRLIHASSGIAILALLLSNYLIFLGMKVFNSRLSEIMDEEIINQEKDSRFQQSSKTIPKLIYYSFLTGFTFTIVSMGLIAIATFPSNWI